jgi:isoaspartyl peptidase/L-asparaginase-like protein (Ntn-hydrolase superfamily)
MAKTVVDYLRATPASQHDCPVPEKPSRVSIRLVAESVAEDAAASPCGENFNAMLAAREAVHLLAHRTHATGGLILLDREGNPGFAFNTPRMAYAYVAGDGSFFTSV